MDAILTTAINFRTAQDVAIYKQFDPEALPDGDRRYTGVATYKVGYRHIVLLDEGGYVIAKHHRGLYKSLAVDGEPIILHGPAFERVGCDEPDPEKEEYAALKEYAQTTDVQDAIDAGKPYRVAWMAHTTDDEGKNLMGYADFDNDADAELEHDARLKTEKHVFGIVLTDI